MAEEYKEWVEPLSITEVDNNPERVAYDPETAHQIGKTEEKIEKIVADSNPDKDWAFVNQYK